MWLKLLWNKWSHRKSWLINNTHGLSSVPSFDTSEEVSLSTEGIGNIKLNWRIQPIKTYIFICISIFWKLCKKLKVYN